MLILSNCLQFSKIDSGRTVKARGKVIDWKGSFWSSPKTKEVKPVSCKLKWELSKEETKLN